MKPGLIYLIGGSLISLLMGIIVTIILPAAEPIGPTALARPYTAQELWGREIYKREGCHYCHTQQVRGPEANASRIHQPGDIGPQSMPGDYYYQSPVFWGTERQGPDLAHVASRHGIGDNPEWLIAHFKDPRGLTSSASIMPSFDYLSQAELEALTAYIMTLK